MPHRKKLLQIVEDLGRAPSLVSLTALNLLNDTAQYAKEYHGEKTMSEQVAQRVHAVFVNGLKHEAYNLPLPQRRSFVRYQYHRPAAELGIN